VGRTSDIGAILCRSRLVKRSTVFRRKPDVRWVEVKADMAARAELDLEPEIERN
jgi:hypothetical protein